MHLYLEPPSAEQTKHILAQPWVALDTEYGGTTNFPANPSKKVGASNKEHPDQFTAKLAGFSLWYPGCPYPEGAYFPTTTADHVFNARWLDVFLREYTGQVWFHNAQADLTVLCHANHYDYPKQVCDSVVLAWVLGKYDPLCASLLKELSLDSLVRRELGVAEGKSFQDMAQGRDACDIPPEEMAPYAAKDAWYTGRLVEKLLPELEAKPKIKDHFYSVEMPCLRVVNDMYVGGVPIDSEALTEAVRGLSELEAQFRQEFYDLTETWVELPTKVKEPTGELSRKGKPKFKTVEKMLPQLKGASISSSQQVSRWLCEELEWWPANKLPRTKEGKIGTDSKALKALKQQLTDPCAIEAIELKDKYSKVSKLRSTYLSPFPAYEKLRGTGFVYPQMIQHGTKTSRFSSRSPNIMNLPRHSDADYEGIEMPSIRRAIKAPEGWLLAGADYAQLELRILAHITQDECMMQSIHDGVDLHALTIERCKKDFNMEVSRVLAKGAMFAIVYGSSAFGLSGQLGITKEEAGNFIKAIYTQYPGLGKFHERILKYARKHNSVPTLTGYVRKLSYPEGVDFSKMYKLPKDLRKRISAEDRKAKNCFDIETEVLTEHGWMRGWDVPSGVRILTREPHTGKLEWNIPYTWHRHKDYCGPMYRFKHRGFDSLTTHNHRWPVWNRKSNREQFVTSEVLAKSHGDMKVIRTGLTDEHTSSFWELVGWVLTDGSYHTNGTTVYVHQSKAYGVDRLRKLSDTGLLKERKPYKNGVVPFLLHSEAARRIREITPTRELTPGVCMAAESKISLLRGLIGGDGSKHGNSYRLCCGELAQAEAAQMLVSLCGKHATITKRFNPNPSFSPKVQPKGVKSTKPYYVVTVCLREKTQVLPSQVEVVEDTPHDIWCPEVKNQTLLVRRNGHVYFSGNTPIQGSAGGIVKLAMNKLHGRWAGTNNRIITQVHDELLCLIRDVGERENEVRRNELQSTMENAFSLRVPLVAEANLGKTWAELK